MNSGGCHFWDLQPRPGSLALGCEHSPRSQSLPFAADQALGFEPAQVVADELLARLQIGCEFSLGWCGCVGCLFGDGFEDHQSDIAELIDIDRSGQSREFCLAIDSVGVVGQKSAVTAAPYLAVMLEDPQVMDGLMISEFEGANHA